MSTEAKRSQIPNHIQRPSQPNSSTPMPSFPCSTLSQLYVKQGIRSLYFIITLCLWSGLKMQNAHYRAQACRAMLNSKYISETHWLRHYIDYKLQDIILMLSEGSQWQQLKYHVQSQPHHQKRASRWGIPWWGIHSPTGSNDYRCYLHQCPCRRYQDDGSQLRLQT